MTEAKIVHMSHRPDGFGQIPDTLSQDMFESSLPLQHTHEYFSDGKLGIYVGVWDTTDMVETAGQYPCDEFMVLLEGDAAIRNCKTGEIETAVAGEPFVIPRGYDCQWRQSDYLRKFFLIYENPNGAMPEHPAFEGIIIPRAETNQEGQSASRLFIANNTATTQTQHVSYENNCGDFLVGNWQSESFESAALPSPHYLFALIISGSLRLIDDAGKQHQFESGDALFIPKGVTFSASSPGTVSLFFALVTP